MVILPDAGVVKGEPEMGLVQAESVYTPNTHPPRLCPVFVAFWITRLPVIFSLTALIVMVLFGVSFVRVTVHFVVPLA